MIDKAKTRHVKHRLGAKDSTKAHESKESPMVEKAEDAMEPKSK